RSAVSWIHAPTPLHDVASAWHSTYRSHPATTRSSGCHARLGIGRSPASCPRDTSSCTWDGRGTWCSAWLVTGSGKPHIDSSRERHPDSCTNAVRHCRRQLRTVIRISRQRQLVAVLRSNQSSAGCSAVRPSCVSITLLATSCRADFGRRADLLVGGKPIGVGH
ncbi:MAG: hypothetical protein ACI91B_004150, partial [Planctomycetota bacterium]